MGNKMPAVWSNKRQNVEEEEEAFPVEVELRAARIPLRIDGFRPRSHQGCKKVTWGEAYFVQRRPAQGCAK